PAPGMGGYLYGSIGNENSGGPFTMTGPWGGGGAARPPPGVAACLQRERALDDRAGVDAGRQRAERAAGLPESAGAERVGDGGWRVAQQERGLEGHGEILDDPAGQPFRVAVAQRDDALAGRREVGVETRVRPRGELALGEERRHALGFRAHGAQDVQREDVPRALPDRA